MDEISTVEAREQFAEVVNRAAYGKERLILTRRGKALAAIVPIDDLELIRELEDRIDAEEARRAKEEAERDGWTTLDQLREELAR